MSDSYFYVIVRLFVSQVRLRLEGINSVAHGGNVLRSNIKTPYVLIAIVVMNTQIMFIANPVDAMSLVDILEAE